MQLPLRRLKLKGFHFLQNLDNLVLTLHFLTYSTYVITVIQIAR